MNEVARRADQSQSFMSNSTETTLQTRENANVTFNHFFH